MVDFLVVPTAAFKLLFGLVILRHDRRRLVHIAVSTSPTADWIARQITEAFPWDAAPKYLIRDRDGIYGVIFRRRLGAMGIRDRPTAPRSPWQNGCVERLIGSIRNECLDHVIVLGAAHLRRVLAAYADYYNRTRTHLSLNKDTPMARPILREGQITLTSVACAIPWSGFNIRKGQEAVEFAILTLIQVITPPAIQMRSPERLQFQALRSRQPWHDRPSQSRNLAVRRRSHPGSREQACQSRALTHWSSDVSLFWPRNSLYLNQISLFFI